MKFIEKLSWQGVTGIGFLIIGLVLYLLNQAAAGSALLIISIVLTTWSFLKGWNTRDFWK